MATPLLQTKLYIPPVRPGLVSRPRLIERLNDGIHSGRKLTLISAPAGFGKTTLLCEWIHCKGAVTAPLQVAWLSLDKGDNDLNRFLAYLVAALQTIEGTVGQGPLAALQSPGQVNAGLVDDFALGSVTPFDQGSFFLVRQEDGGFLALYRHCTHLGCSVSHNSHEGEFQCACHGAAFRLDGEVLIPPATRPLDLFPVSIENGTVTVNTAQTIERAEADPSYVVYPE